MRALVLLTLAAGAWAQDTASLSGVVQSSTGAGLAEVTIRLLSDDHEVRSYRAMTNEAGEYQFTGVRPGPYTMHLDSHFARSLPIRRVQLAKSEQRILPPIELQLYPYPCEVFAPDYLVTLPPATRSGNLSGEVRSLEEGRTLLANADVTLYCDRSVVCGKSKTDKSGHFTFRELSPGWYSISAAKAGFHEVAVSRYRAVPGFDSVYAAIGLSACYRGDCRSRIVAPINVVCE